MHFFNLFVSKSHELICNIQVCLYHSIICYVPLDTSCNLRESYDLRASCELQDSQLCLVFQQKYVILMGTRAYKDNRVCHANILPHGSLVTIISTNNSQKMVLFGADVNLFLFDQSCFIFRVRYVEYIRFYNFNCLLI